MAILSLILSFTSCLNNGYLKTSAYDIHNSILNEKANLVLEESLTYDFSDEVEDSSLKSHYLSFNEEHNTLTSSELIRMRMFASNPTFSPELGLFNLGINIDDSQSTDLPIFRPELDIYTIDIDDEPDIDDQLPIYTYRADKVNLTLNGINNNRTFFGLYATPDACICFYNIVANFVNTFVTEEVNNILTLINNFFPSIFPYMLNIIKTNFEAIISMIGASILSTITAVIIGVLVFLALSYLAGMFVAGYQMAGFFVGWIVENFTWTWYSNLIL